MRYLVRAKVKPGMRRALLRAIDRRALGRGSVAAGEYLRNMAEARVTADGAARDLDGSEPWACETCDCTGRLEQNLARHGEAFLDRLRRDAET